ELQPPRLQARAGGVPPRAAQGLDVRRLPGQPALHRPHRGQAAGHPVAAGRGEPPAAGLRPDLCREAHQAVRQRRWWVARRRLLQQAALRVRPVHDPPLRAQRGVRGGGLHRQEQGHGPGRDPERAQGVGRLARARHPGQRRPGRRARRQAQRARGSQADAGRRLQALAGVADGDHRANRVALHPLHQAKRGQGRMVVRRAHGPGAAARVRRPRDHPHQLRRLPVTCGSARVHPPLRRAGGAGAAAAARRAARRRPRGRVVPRAGDAHPGRGVCGGEGPLPGRPDEGVLPRRDAGADREAACRAPQRRRHGHPAPGARLPAAPALPPAARRRPAHPALRPRPPGAPPLPRRSARASRPAHPVPRTRPPGPGARQRAPPRRREDAGAGSRLPGSPRVPRCAAHAGRRQDPEPRARLPGPQGGSPRAA
ncbi:hypothetical protein GGI06_005989, partial [Coemansia sp. S85]